MRRANLNDKSLVVLWALWVLILPWMAGGRDAAAQLISFMTASLGLFFVWRLAGTRSLDKGLLTRAAGALLLWSAASQIWSINRYQTFNWVLLLILAYATFILAQQIGEKPERRRAWTDGYLITASVFSAYGLYLYIVESYDRLTSSFFAPNVMAAYLIPAVLLSVWYFLEEGRWRYLAPALITGAALVLTNSRSAYILVGIIGFVSLASLRRRVPFWLRLIGTVALVAAMVIAVNLVRAGRQPAEPVIAPGSRFSDAVQAESTSRDDRLYYLKSTLEIAKDYPVQGTGAGTYPSIHPHYQQRVISAGRHAHNFYAQTVAEIGLIGAVLLALTFLAVAFGVIRGVRADKSLTPMAVALLALATHFGLDIDSDYPTMVMLLASLAGLIYQSAKGEGSARRAAGRLLLIMLVVTLPVIHRYQSRVQAERAEYEQSESNFETAADLYRRAHAGLVYNPDTLLGEGINYYALASLGIEPEVNFTLARDRAFHANRLDPWDAQHTFLLGRVLEARGDVTAALAAYKRTLDLDPYNNPAYYADPAQLYLENGNLDEALRLADAGIQLYPDPVIANRHQLPGIRRSVANLYTIRAIVRNARGELEAALADLAEARRLDPSNARATQLELQIRANIGH